MPYLMPHDQEGGKYVEGRNDHAWQNDENAPEGREHCHHIPPPVHDCWRSTPPPGPFYIPLFILIIPESEAESVFRTNESGDRKKENRESDHENEEWCPKGKVLPKVEAYHGNHIGSVVF